MDINNLENLSKYAVLAWTEYSEDDKGWEVQNTGITYEQARKICDMYNLKDFENNKPLKYRVATVEYKIVG